MKLLKSTYQIFVKTTENSQSLLLLALRLAMAHVFVWSGWGKLNHLSRVVEFFTQLGLPAPGFQAPFVAACELGFGLLILFGLFTRLAAIPMIVIMLVALGTAKMSDIHSIDSLMSIPEFLYIFILATLISFGGGKFSLDFFFDKKLRSN